MPILDPSTAPPATRKKRPAIVVASLGPLGVSVIIHLILFLFIGSVVVFEAPLIPDFFRSDDIVAEAESLDTEPVIIEEEQALPEFSAVETVTAEGGTVEDDAATPIDLIISSVPASAMNAFSLPRNVGSPTATLFGKKSSGDGDGIGGKGRAVTASLFGRTIEARNLGVVLDVSGSAHAHLQKAIDEIDRNFPQAYIVLVVGCGMSDGTEVERIAAKSNLVPGKPRIAPYNNRGEDEKYDSIERSVAGQLAKLGVGQERGKKLERYFKQRQNLYMLYGGDILGTNFAFDFLLEQGTDAIYWFADFADRIDDEVLEKLSRDLSRKGVKVVAHNFMGRSIPDKVKSLAEQSGGSTIEIVPGQEKKK